MIERRPSFKVSNHTKPPEVKVSLLFATNSQANHRVKCLLTVTPTSVQLQVLGLFLMYLIKN